LADLRSGGPIEVAASHVVQESPKRLDLLRSIVGWFREGYPQGVPERDYIPLLAILRRRVTDEEIEWIVGQAVASGTTIFGQDDIGVLITKVTDEIPSPEDIQRVGDRLTQSGFPVVPSTGGDRGDEPPTST
jgi:hypothetical protein